MSGDTDAWMPFYISDYLRDTQHLSTAEHGAYFLLIMHAWTHEGALPCDETRVARIAKMTPKEWKASREVILEFLALGNDCYRIPRVDHAADKPLRLAWDEWQKVRAAVFLRDDFTCVYCGHRGGNLECDHVIPIARGGGNGLDNLVTSCPPCNRAKGSKLLSEWAA